MNQKVKAILQQEVAKWLQEGSIEPATYEMLTKRYQIEHVRFTDILKYLGVIGGLCALFGFLGMIASLQESLWMGIFILIAIFGSTLYFGIRWARDPRNPHPYSSNAILTLSMLSYVGVLLCLGKVFELKTSNQILAIGLLGAPVVFTLAYLRGNTFLLTLAMVGVFHWVGSWERMAGSSTYETSMQDPRVMALFSAVVIFVGWLHSRIGGARNERFASVYQAVGLLYLNASLLILSVDSSSWRSFMAQWVYISLALGVFLAQIVLGARIKRAMFTSFGVTFFGIHVFTLYYEHFWDPIQKGWFFFIGGLLLILFGFLCERALEQIQRRWQ